MPKTTERKTIPDDKKVMVEAFYTVTRSEELAEVVADNLLLYQGAALSDETAREYLDSVVSKLRWQYSTHRLGKLVDTLDVEKLASALLAPDMAGPSLVDLSDANKRLLMSDIMRLTELFGHYSGLSPNETAVSLPAGLQAQVLNRTASGLYLRFRDDVPTGVLTPWGLWPMTHRQKRRIDVEGFMKHLLTRVHQKARSSGDTIYGPTLELLMIDDKALPTPSFNGDLRKDVDHAAIHAEWEQLYGS